MLFTDQLRKETQDLHQAVERRMGLDKPLTLARYQRLLKAFYGLYDPFESHFFSAPGLDRLLPDLESRRKTRWLSEDLVVSGLTTSDLRGIPRFSLTRTFKEIPSALGTFYVLEGATLGGGIIGPLVDRTLHLTASSGSRFFHSYGDARGGMWQTFKNALSAYVETSDGRQAILTAARETFSGFDRWLSVHYE